MPAFEVEDGANDPDRTDDLIITNDLLYQLSYVGVKTGVNIPIFGLVSQAPHEKEKKHRWGLTG